MATTLNGLSINGILKHSMGAHHSMGLSHAQWALIEKLQSDASNFCLGRTELPYSDKTLNGRTSFLKRLRLAWHAYRWIGTCSIGWYGQERVDSELWVNVWLRLKYECPLSVLLGRRICLSAHTRYNRSTGGATTCAMCTWCRRLPCWGVRRSGPLFWAEPCS